MARAEAADVTDQERDFLTKLSQLVLSLHEECDQNGLLTGSSHSQPSS